MIAAALTLTLHACLPDTITVFGDSVLDVGNAWYDMYPEEGSDFILAGPPYSYSSFKGFQNDRDFFTVWKDHWPAAEWPVPNASHLGGSNFAYSGARVKVGKHSCVSQVEDYVARGCSADSLHFVLCGLNDIPPALREVFNDPARATEILESAATDAADGIEEILSSLEDCGANNIAVMLLPALGFTPASIGSNLNPLIQTYTGPQLLHGCTPNTTSPSSANDPFLQNCMTANHAVGVFNQAFRTVLERPRHEVFVYDMYETHLSLYRSKWIHASQDSTKTNGLTDFVNSCVYECSLLELEFGCVSYPSVGERECERRAFVDRIHVADRFFEDLIVQGELTTTVEDDWQCKFSPPSPPSTPLPFSTSSSNWFVPLVSVASLAIVLGLGIVVSVVWG
jgi:hypothetical protein